MPGQQGPHLQRVGLQLHQQPVARAAAVRPQQPELAARVCRHGVHHLPRLRHAAQHPQRVHFSTRQRARSRRRGNHRNSSGVRCRADHQARAASASAASAALRVCTLVLHLGLPTPQALAARLIYCACTPVQLPDP